MKKVLIYTDQHKFDVLIAERKRFAQELNDGIELLKGLPFVEPDQDPSLEELKNPVEWFDSCILKATQPRKIKGIDPAPKALAETYRVDYDSYVAKIHKVPWNAISLVDYVDGQFQVTPKIEEQVREVSSTYGTVEQAEEFEKLDVLLNHLNEFCDKYVTDRMNINIMADTLHCRYIQLPDKSRRIVPNYRVAMIAMERVTAV